MTTLDFDGALKENMFNCLASETIIGIYCVHPNGTFQYVNEGFSELFGYSHKEIYQYNLFELFHPDDIATVKQNIKNRLDGKVTISKYETRGIKKDQSIVNIGVHGHIIYNKNYNTEPFILGTMVDITGPTKIRTDLKQAKQNLQLLIEGSPLAMVALDTEMNVKLWNQAAEKMFGWMVEEVLDRPFQIIPDSEKDKFNDLFSYTLSGNSLTNVETKRRTKNGEIIDVSISTAPWYDMNKNKKQYIAIFQDISNRKIFENEMIHALKRMAYYDHLTDLPNRRLFEDKLKDYLTKAKIQQTMLALLFLDLDGFKLINDTIGHEIGDKLLQEVANRLVQTSKETDLVARLGGDEFTIIITDIKEMTAIHKFAHKLLSIFDHPFQIDNYELYITTSIGISIYPQGGEDIKKLIKNADLAMYRAKEDGKNKYEVYSPTMNVGTYKKFSLQNDLRKAIQDQEFFLQYQPRITCHTNNIVAVEALVRWKHPNWGIISPNEFISLAEESGLINKLGEQVLYMACEQNKKWQNAGYTPIMMSVNFSPLQFSQADLVATVQNILVATGLDPKWLEIEFTESAVMKNETGTLSKLEQLRALGISIAIDDFGTGFSSLSYLKKIKPNTLKIDRSFIQEIPTDRENTEIATAIITLAEKLAINVVAEGVETIEQYAFLQDLHCNELQGYLFSKPISSEDLSRILKVGKLEPTKEVPIKDVSFKNRRAFDRVTLPRPLMAEMTITSIGGNNLRLGMTRALIENIGSGGLCFSSNIKLPSSPTIILKIRTLILEQKIELTGLIVWMKKIDQMYHYGLQYNMDDNARNILNSLLDNFQVKLQNKEAAASWFLTTSRDQFFHKWQPTS